MLNVFLSECLREKEIGTHQSKAEKWLIYSSVLEKIAGLDGASRGLSSLRPKAEHARIVERIR